MTTRIVLAPDPLAARTAALEGVLPGTEVEVTVLGATMEYDGYICASYIKTVSATQYKRVQEESYSEAHVETLTT